ncbi:hypothetical protein F2Q68_00024683 [Brassica cretica]|uniref:Uncharacterized protein n=1 Tax=Brassica cretica TaxID=69181 RepID=A0A8S9IE34_BRACR|nr:hypothetical protein F2Q68_00024683 [Brassica cretica]
MCVGSLLLGGVRWKPRWRVQLFGLSWCVESPMLRRQYPEKLLLSLTSFLSAMVRGVSLSGFDLAVFGTLGSVRSSLCAVSLSLVCLELEFPLRRRGCDTTYPSVGVGCCSTGLVSFFYITLVAAYVTTPDFCSSVELLVALGFEFHTTGGGWEALSSSIEVVKLSEDGTNQLEQRCGEAKITKVWSHVLSKVSSPFGNAPLASITVSASSDLSSDEPLNSIPSRVPVSASARSDDQPQPVRERQPKQSRPNKPNPIASSQLAIPKQPARDLEAASSRPFEVHLGGPVFYNLQNKGNPNSENMN